MEIALTKMSSKGQVVIPASLRKNIKEGETLMIIQNNGQLILKKATELEKKMKEDLEFAKRTEEAWKRYEKGEFIEMGFEEFLEKLKKW
ncbi:AbrB/MazE/SpoVT family DNA-binding domain-containing protein [Candidatus Woesearchaeota archaeon]|nr:AbrB/MazE/SpoVT family DNA-binding domain-containing protein [Candidatus Woesearchaeota archaeon]